MCCLVATTEKRLGAQSFSPQNTHRLLKARFDAKSIAEPGTRPRESHVRDQLTSQVRHHLPVVFLGVTVRGAHGSKVEGAIGHHEAQAIGFVDLGGAYTAVLVPRATNNNLHSFIRGRISTPFLPNPSRSLICITDIGQTNSAWKFHRYLIHAQRV